MCRPPQPIAVRQTSTGLFPSRATDQPIQTNLRVHWRELPPTPGGDDRVETIRYRDRNHPPTYSRTPMPRTHPFAVFAVAGTFCAALGQTQTFESDDSNDRTRAPTLGGSIRNCDTRSDSSGLARDKLRREQNHPNHLVFA